MTAAGRLKLALMVPGGFGPDPAAVIPALNALAAELARRHEVHVFTLVDPGGGGEDLLAGAQVHRIEYPPLSGDAGLPTRIAALARLIRDTTRAVLRVHRLGRFDCFHGFWINEPGMLALLLGRLLGRPVVASVGGGELVWIPELGYGGGGSRFWREASRAVVRFAHRTTAGSQFARSFLPQDAAARAGVVPLGIDATGTDGEPQRPAGPPWRLLHVAHLNAIKDQRTLLEGFKLVVQRLPDVTLDCIGADTLNGATQRQAVTLGIADRVRFHGLLPPAQVATFYRSAHLHVLTSRYESQGVVVLEAGAAGLPTVGTAVGLLPEMAPMAARCVEVGDAPALADAIVTLLRDEASRVALGAAARRFATEHDTRWTAAAFEEIYRELVPG